MWGEGRFLSILATVPLISPADTVAHVIFRCRAGVTRLECARRLPARALGLLFLVPSAIRVPRLIALSAAGKSLSSPPFRDATHARRARRALIPFTPLASLESLITE